MTTSDSGINPDEILREAHEKTDWRIPQGEETRKAREELGISQIELAEMLDLKESDVALFEQGMIVSRNVSTQLIFWTQHRKPGEIY